MSRPVLHPAALRYVGPAIARDDSETRLILAIHRRGLAAARHWLDRDFEGLSQSEAVALTGLSQASVSTLAKGLRARGLLLADSDGLVLDPTAGIAFGIDIGFRQVRAAVSDLHGQLLDPDGIPPFRYAALGADAATSLDWMEQQLLELEARAREDVGPSAQIIGAGVGLAGPVDRASGKLLPAWGTGGDWRLLSAAAELKQRLGWDTEFISDRDANASAAAEVLWGNDRTGETPDVLYCKWAEGGVSAALIFDHQVFHGGGGIAGEIAHTVVPLGHAHETDAADKCLTEWFAGQICKHCGRQRCLWAVTSLERFRGFLKDPDVDAKTIVSRARSYKRGTHVEGSPEYEARHALTAAGRCLGRVLAPLIEAFNPTKVILGGKIGARAFQTVNSALVAGVAEQGVSPAISAAELSGASTELTGRSSVRGAIALALVEAAPYRLHQLAQQQSARNGSGSVRASPIRSR